MRILGEMIIGAHCVRGRGGELRVFDRFLRPVCYQDVPAGLLPALLRDDNLLCLARLQDGELKGQRMKMGGVS